MQTWTDTPTWTDVRNIAKRMTADPSEDRAHRTEHTDQKTGPIDLIQKNVVVIIVMRKSIRVTNTTKIMRKSIRTTGQRRRKNIRRNTSTTVVAGAGVTSDHLTKNIDKETIILFEKRKLK